MLQRIRYAPKQSARTGSTLALSLIVVTTLVVLSGTFLQFSSALTHRQGQASDVKRAFYVAEAGLAESVAGIRVGKSGSVGSIDDPARFGNGLFWVEVTDLGDGQLALKSTGMCGSARTSLDLVVKEGTDSVAALGLFTDGDLELPSDSLIDSYDSTEPLDDPEPDPAPGRGGLGGLGRGLGGVGGIEGIEGIEELNGGGIELFEFDDQVFVADLDSAVVIYEEIGTPNAARVSSNGNVTVYEDLGGETRVLGDIRPGENGTITMTGAPEISGSTDPLSTPVVLPPVRTPAYEIGPGYRQSSSTPVIFPAIQAGYEYLVIETNCQATITGPSTVVFEDLIVEPGGELLIDTSGGSVDVFVTESLDLQAGSYVTMTELDPNPMRFSLQYSGTLTAEILADAEFHGFLYAPNATMNVASSFEIFGSLVGSSIVFVGPARVHFDVALGAFAERAALPSLMSWRIVEMAGAAAPTGNPFLTLGVDKDLLLAPGDAHEDQELAITYYDRSGTVQTYVGWESSFDWSDVSQVLKIERDNEVVGGVEGLAGIGGVGAGTGNVGSGKNAVAVFQ